MGASLRWAVVAIVAAPLFACGTNDAGGRLDAGMGGTAAGGSSAGTGGSSGLGGSGAGGAGGSAGTTGGGGPGGTGASGGGGLTGGGGGGNSGGYVDFWPAPYDPSCAPPTPSPDTHDAYKTMVCQNCHTAGGDAGPGNEFLIGGVVYQFGTDQGLEHIEVGIRDGTNFIYACTDARGFFSAPVAGNTEPNWPASEHRIRNALGEKLMPDPLKQAGTCNGPLCHADPKQHLFF